MKTCGSCFRYVENPKDVKFKGFEPRHRGLTDCYRKPRKGIKPIGLGIGCPDDIRADYPACKAHKYRLLENIRMWYLFKFNRIVWDWYRKQIRVPLGGLRKPVSLEWRDSFCGMTDTITKNGEPVCPRCKEYPYSIEQCAFCGQRFKD